LEETQQKITSLVKQKTLNEGRLDQLQIDKEKVISELKSLGVNNPSDLKLVKEQLQKDIDQLKIDVDNIFLKLSDGVKNELESIESNSNEISAHKTNI
jgi:hypothetical protein